MPYAVVYETAHFGADIGIVSGERNRAAVIPLVTEALATDLDPEAYARTAQLFQAAHARTFQRAAKLRWNPLDWDRQAQYEGHAQLIFRIRDQHGQGVEHFDITLKSRGRDRSRPRIETLIEDHHGNRRHPGTITYYLRTQQFDRDTKSWRDLVGDLLPVDVEITGEEPLSEDIAYVPLTLSLSAQQIGRILASFQTTVVDVTLVRLPSQKVFAITPA